MAKEYHIEVKRFLEDQPALITQIITGTKGADDLLRTLILHRKDYTRDITIPILGNIANDEMNYREIRLAAREALCSYLVILIDDNENWRESSNSDDKAIICCDIIPDAEKFLASLNDTSTPEELLTFVPLGFYHKTRWLMKVLLVNVIVDNYLSKHVLFDEEYTKRIRLLEEAAILGSCYKTGYIEQLFSVNRGIEINDYSKTGNLHKSVDDEEALLAFARWLHDQFLK